MSAKRANLRAATPFWVPLIAVILFGGIIAATLAYFQERVRQSPGFAVVVDSMQRAPVLVGAVGTPVTVASWFVRSDVQRTPQGEVTLYAFTVAGPRGQRSLRALTRSENGEPHIEQLVIE